MGFEKVDLRPQKLEPGAGPTSSKVKKHGFYDLLNKASEAKAIEATARKKPKDDNVSFFGLINGTVQSRPIYDERTPHSKGIDASFNIRINAYVIYMIVAGLMLLLSFIINIVFLELVSTYSMGWIFLFFYTMCGLDAAGSYFGVISLMSEYTFGGWRLCNWIISSWNKKHDPKMISNAKSTKSVNPVKSANLKQQNKTRGGPLGASVSGNHQKDLTKPKQSVLKISESNNKINSTDSKAQLTTLRGKLDDKEFGIGPNSSKMKSPPVISDITPHGEKLSIFEVLKAKQRADEASRAAKIPLGPSETSKTSTMSKEGQLSKNPQHAQGGRLGGQGKNAWKKIQGGGQKKQRVNPNPKGCFWKTRYHPCRLCTSGITVNTKKVSGRMSFLSCLMIYTAGFMGLMCTAFHKYMNDMGSEFYLENKLCEEETQPRREVCDMFDTLFTTMLIFTWITIILRTLLLIIIGWHLDARQLDMLRPVKKTAPEQHRISKEEISELGDTSDKPGQDPKLPADQEVGNEPKSENQDKKKKKKKKKRHDDSTSSSSGGSGGDDNYNVQDAIKLFYHNQIGKHKKDRVSIVKQGLIAAASDADAHDEKRGTQLNFPILAMLPPVHPHDPHAHPHDLHVHPHDPQVHSHDPHVHPHDSHDPHDPHVHPHDPHTDTSRLSLMPMIHPHEHTSETTTDVRFGSTTSLTSHVKQKKSFHFKKK